MSAVTEAFFSSLFSEYAMGLTTELIIKVMKKVSLKHLDCLKTSHREIFFF